MKDPRSIDEQIEAFRRGEGFEPLKQTEMRPYDPTPRERLSSGLQSGLEAIGLARPRARSLSQTVFGGESSNLPIGMGLADVTPFLGTALQTPEAIRDLQAAGTSAQQGDVIGAGIEGLFGVMGMIPGVAATKKALTKTKPAIVEGGVKQRGAYETKQEGPFYRVRPSNDQAAQGKGFGTKEDVGSPSVAGGARGDVSQPVTDETVRSVMNSPDNFVRQVANQYSLTATKQPYELPNIPQSSLAKQGGIGRTFELAASDDSGYKKAVFDAYASKYPDLVDQSGAVDYDSLMAKSYAQLAKETKDQFNALPVNMSFHRAGEGNYADSKELLRDIYGNRHMYVYQGGDPHDFLNEVDPSTGLNTNEMFRAVHDFFGHAIHGNQFGPKGEEIAWAAHSKMFSPLARIAMTSETRGQNSFVNYTPINAELKSLINELNADLYDARRRGNDKQVREIEGDLKEAWSNFQFAPQKSLILPPEFLDLDYTGGIPGYLKPLIRPQSGTAVSERLTHFSPVESLIMTDPKRFGTGIKGAEMERLRGTTSPVMERSYFYTGDPSQIQPEAGLGGFRYGAQGQDLYDISADPLGFSTLSREVNRMPYSAKFNKGVVDRPQMETDIERLAKEYGYQGLVSPKQGMAIMYEPVPVQRFGKGGGVKSDVKEWVKNASENIKSYLKKKGGSASDTALQNALEKSATDIAQANPKLSELELAKRAENDVRKKFTWERVDKPEAEKKFGALQRSSYSDPKGQRLRNTDPAVQERIQKTLDFLSAPTKPWTPPKKELQAFDRSSIKDALEGFPGVEQTRFTRDVAPRANIDYVTEMYEDPVNRSLIEQQIKRGLPLGGETFYASLYPLQQAALDRNIPIEKFQEFVYALAPASARNSILNEVAVGQFLRDMHARGLPLDQQTVDIEKELFKKKYGVGLPLMPIHREGVQDVLENRVNLRDRSIANIPTNYKIPTYGTQKAGDFGKSVVLDVHEAAGQTRGSAYHPYFTEQGGFQNKEYGAAENEMLKIAESLGIPGGMAQAGRWFGGGELTGLKSPRGDALDLLERQAAYTLQGQGVTPTPKNVRNYILDMIETGQGVMMPYYKSDTIPDMRVIKKKKGGPVKAPASALSKVRKPKHG